MTVTTEQSTPILNAIRRGIDVTRSAGWSPESVHMNRITSMELAQELNICNISQIPASAPERMEIYGSEIIINDDMADGDISIAFGMV